MHLNLPHNSSARVSSFTSKTHGGQSPLTTSKQRSAGVSPPSTACATAGSFSAGPAAEIAARAGATPSLLGSLKKGAQSAYAPLLFSSAPASVASRHGRMTLSLPRLCYGAPRATSSTPLPSKFASTGMSCPSSVAKSICRVTNTSTLLSLPNSTSTFLTKLQLGHLARTLS